MTPATAAPTILLVDDYLDALEVWDVYLRSAGFNVLTAADGQQAVAMVEAQRPDLVVMDLNLPGLSGIEVARVLRSREETRDLPLIAATGYSYDTETDGGRQAGFDAVIVKPCDPELLVAEIRRLLGAPVRPEPTST
jgi:CheY-like chemotaxis protein